MKKTKFLILGGGITGLTFASCVTDYIILEKEDKIGGYCQTIKRSEYIWDYAGHFFHFNNPKLKERFINAIPKEDIIVQKKNTKIIYGDKLIDYPFQMNIHQLPQQDFIDCLYDLFNKKEKTYYDNFLDMLYGKFGESIVEKFLRPYNEKLYAIDLSKLDVDAMGRFFPYADKEMIIKNMKQSTNKSYNDSFLYPKYGAETFINVLVNSLDRNRILLNTTVEEINKKEKFVVTSSSEKIYYEYIINTTPLNKFLPLVDKSNLVNKLSYNKVLVFNLGFNKKSKFDKEHWLYIPSKEYNYYRIGFYDNILNQNKLSMYVEIGYNKEDVITDEEIKRQLELTLNNLKKQDIIDDGIELVDYVSIVMDPAYVHISKKTNELIDDLFKKLKNDNIYSIGRYGSWTYCSMEDCMMSAQNLAQEIDK